MIKNLDFLCAECGRMLKEKKIADDKNLIQKSLGILQEDGLYALTLYLDKEKKNTLREEIEKFLQEKGIISDNLRDENIYTNLHKLLLVKSIVEKILIYTLYHIKAGEMK